MTEALASPTSVGAAPDLMVEVDEVSVHFGRLKALDRVSLRVPTGTVCALLGHNGAGKTTLVNVLSTQLVPASGRARVAGMDVVRDAAALRGRIGLTGQFASVDEQLSGWRNLLLIGRLLGATNRAARARADELLDTFGLTDAALRQVKTYSGGMRRRLDLAASLVGHPDVIFLDEPTTGLDPAARIMMWQIVQQLVREGTTVLLTTQYLDEADQLADTITVLSHGTVVATGTPAELKARTGTRTVTVTLADTEDAAKAAEAVRRFGLHPLSVESDTADAEEAPVAESVGRVLTMAVERSTDLAMVVRALDEASVEPVGLALVEPRLDDVYLQLSGAAVSDAHPV